MKNKQATDFRMKIFTVAVILLIVIGGIFIFSGNNDEKSKITSGTPKLKASETIFDFGDISMADGFAVHNFIIENEGDGDLKIFDMETSCMCTTAVLNIDGKRSPKFGMKSHGTNPKFWSETINSGQNANLEVTFNPNAHGPNATGPITRVVTLKSNDGGTEKFTKFTISANVTK